MAAPPIVDLHSLDLGKLAYTQDQIYQTLPHRFEFMQIDGVVHIDPAQRIAVGLKEIREDEFWVRGHIPGRPLFPGVLMVEAAAQLASFLTTVLRPDDRFLGFGGLDKVKFRRTVAPPARMYLLLRATDIRPRRTVCDAQGICDDQLVFEAKITGMPIPG